MSSLCEDLCEGLGRLKASTMASRTPELFLRVGKSGEVVLVDVSGDSSRMRLLPRKLAHYKQMSNGIVVP